MKTTSYLSSLTRQFLYYKTLGEKAMEQVPDPALFWKYNEESNSLAILVTHLAGNMLSRFTEFMTTDGEKPWRNRDTEFEERFSTRQEVMDYWNKGWQCLMEALNGLDDSQLETLVYIRNEGHTVTEALNRQLAHYAYHVGQMVFLSKMIVNKPWQSLSIPRHASGAYNAEKFNQKKG